jgi:hypothetical protein
MRWWGFWFSVSLVLAGSVQGFAQQQQPQAGLDKLELATAIGPVTVGPEHVARVRVTGGAANAKGLLLWNTFDSREELVSSRVGPGGEWRRGRFVKWCSARSICVVRP